MPQDAETEDDVYLRKEAGPKRSWYKYAQWILVGRGEQSGENCGRFVRARTCRAHPTESLSLIFHSCDTPKCPICYTKSVKSRVPKILRRLVAGNYLYFFKGESLGFFKHASLHMNVSESIRLLYEPNGYKRLKNRAMSRIKKIGIKGGIIVFHPFRKACGKCVPSHKSTTQEMDSVLGLVRDVHEWRSGKWSVIKKKDGYHCSKCGSQDWFWVPSPHFHLVYQGHHMDTAEMKKLRCFSSWGFTFFGELKTIADISKVLFYELSHAGLTRVDEESRYKPIFTPFGLYSNSRVCYRKNVNEKVIYDEYEKNEVCSQDDCGRTQEFLCRGRCPTCKGNYILSTEIAGGVVLKYLVCSECGHTVSYSQENDVCEMLPSFLLWQKGKIDIEPLLSYYKEAVRKIKIPYFCIKGWQVNDWGRSKVVVVAQKTPFNKIKYAGQVLPELEGAQRRVDYTRQETLNISISESCVIT